MKPLLRYFDFLKEMIKSDFKLRYHSSFLGALWSFLRPLSLFIIFYFVFSNIIRFDIPNYPLYLLIGIIIWNYFVESTTSSINSLTNKATLIRKIYFPKFILIISAIAVAFIHFIITFLVFIMFIPLVGIKLHLDKLFLFLVLMGPLLLFSGGVGLFLSALNVKFRDISHLWEILLQIIFWLSPIVYPVALLPTYLKEFLSITNPLFHIIEYGRAVLLRSENVSIIQVMSLYGFTLLLAFLGYLFFKSREFTFAEEI